MTTSRHVTTAMLAMTAGLAAQVQLSLAGTVDLSSTSNSANAEYIGNNPSAIAWNGTDLDRVVRVVLEDPDPERLELRQARLGHPSGEHHEGVGEVPGPPVQPRLVALQDQGVDQLVRRGEVRPC